MCNIEEKMQDQVEELLELEKKAAVISAEIMSLYQYKPCREIVEINALLSTTSQSLGFCANKITNLKEKEVVRSKNGGL